MSDDRSRTSRQRRPWALRRLPASLRTFLVVGLAVFLLGLAWHVRRDSRYSAQVAINVAPAVAEVVLAGATPHDEQTGFVAPDEIVAQLDRSLDALGSASSAALSRDDWQDALQVTVARPEPLGPVRIVLDVTDASESRATSHVTLLAEQLARHYTNQARAAAADAHAASQRTVREAHQRVVQARASLEALLDVHFETLSATATRASASPPAEAPTRPTTLTRQQRSTLETQLADLESQRDQLLTRLTALHPLVRGVDDQIEALRTQLAADQGGPSSDATGRNAESSLSGVGVNTKARRIAIPGDSIPAPSAPPASENQNLVISPRGPASGVTLDDQPHTVAPEDTVLDGEQAGTLELATPSATLSPEQRYPSPATLARLAEGDAQYRQRKEAWSAAEAEYQAALAAERATWQAEQQLTDDACRVEAPTGHFVGGQREGRSPAVSGALLLAFVLAGCAALVGGWHAPRFTRFDQIEATLGVPVVGVISAIDDRPATARRPTASKCIAWTTLACEILLGATLVWFILLALGDDHFASTLTADPYAAFVEALDRLPGLGTRK